MVGGKGLVSRRCTLRTCAGKLSEDWLSKCTYGRLRKGQVGAIPAEEPASDACSVEMQLEERYWDDLSGEDWAQKM